MMSAAAWMLAPRLAIWFSLIALLPWAFGLLSGRMPFHRTPFDWLIAIFLVTAWVSYWTAYDRSSAYIKFWLIVNAVLLYYALSAQPKHNLRWMSFLSFCFASAIAIYFFLTYDFAGSSLGVVNWWITHKPQVDWPALHHGNTSGLLLLTSIFAMYWLWGLRESLTGIADLVLKAFLILIVGLIAATFMLAISHGIGLIVLGAGGFWLLWYVSTSLKSTPNGTRIFPILVLVYIAILIVAAYLGPARVPEGLTSGSYGDNSRVEILEQSAHLLADYPIAGAGLNSFPGLYSQYIIVIPYPYFNNSYNIFLDVAIEQGLVGGLIFLMIYLGAIWRVSQTILTTESNELRMVNWFSLLALLVMMIYGLFYDNLYFGSGTALLFFPLGMAMMGVERRRRSKHGTSSSISSESNVAMRVLPVLVLILALAVNFNRVISQGYANLGAVQMSQAELRNFPADQWVTYDMVPGLGAVEPTFQTALRFDPQNQTANYRLGLLSMLRQDFASASTHLEAAYRLAPNHRGIIKNLGYTYAWLGEWDKAQLLLNQIPEAQKELTIYIDWWDTQGRHDLSENASIMLSFLNSPSQ